MLPEQVEFRGWWIIGAVLVIALVLGLLISSCHAQTVCVEPELTVVPDQQAQLQIGRWLRAKGVTVDCSHFDYAISFYQIMGTAYTGEDDYSVQYGTAPGIVTAEVTHWRPRYNYGLWIVTLQLPYKVSTLDRRRATNLKAAVNGVVKTMRKYQ
jgi:hypothetical protein